MICSSLFVRRVVISGLAGFGLMAAAGCHSAYIEATVTNATGAAVSLVEVDYPSASFGSETLASGADYHYRFKVLGEGPTKVLWTDAGHKEHSVPGPVLHEGNEGRMVVTLHSSIADWNLSLKRP